MAKAITAIAPGSEARVVEGLLRQNAHRHDLWSVWSDWVEMQALAIANSCDWSQAEDREKRYLEIVKRYDKAEMDRFAHAAGVATLALERNPWQDFLGSLFMLMEMGNKWAGQFFTPYCVCSMMSAMSLSDEKELPPDGFFTVSDPCVGGGAMLIGACEAMSRRFEHWDRHVHVTGQDVDQKAVHMAYVQLSLIGAPGVIVHGNSLTVEVRSVWHTPAHIMGGWGRKLRQRNAGLVTPVETPPVDQVQQKRTAQEESKSAEETPRKRQKQMEFAL